MIDIERFRMRLAETMSRGASPSATIADPEHCLRKLYFKPSLFNPSSEEAIVEKIARERRWQLPRDERAELTLATDLYDGSLLLFDSYDSLSDGAAVASTNDYFGFDNTPPRDTWGCWNQEYEELNTEPFSA